MHPKAAYLALRGFQCCLYKGGPRNVRIKRGDKDHEKMLYLGAFGWSISTSEKLSQYADVGFGVYSDPQWATLSQGKIEDFCDES